jgi:hypothetical protein
MQSALGQTKVKVKMKSGHSTSGLLKEYHDNDYLILEVADSVTLRVPMSAVEKIKELKYFGDRQAIVPWSYYNYTKFGITFIRTDFGLDGLEWNLHTLHGVHINETFESGVGIGIDRYGNVSSMPIYLGVRGEFGQGHVVPMLLANVGYGYMWEKENRASFNGIEHVSGGMYWEIGGGMTIRNPSTSYSLTLSYKSQGSKIDYDFVDWWTGASQAYQEKRLFQNVSLNFGVSF